MKSKPKKGEPIKDPSELVYYLTLFKLEGHRTWRANFSAKKDAFEKDQKNWGKNPTKVTEKVVMVIDRITGTFKV